MERENAPVWQKQDEKYAEQGLTFSLEEISFESNRKSGCSLAKAADKSLLKGEGWASMGLKDCKETNLFLIGICGAIKLIKKLKGEI